MIIEGKDIVLKYKIGREDQKKIIEIICEMMTKEQKEKENAG